MYIVISIAALLACASACIYSIIRLKRNTPRKIFADSINIATQPTDRHLTEDIFQNTHSLAPENPPAAPTDTPLKEPAATEVTKPHLQYEAVTGEAEGGQ